MKAIIFCLLSALLLVFAMNATASDRLEWQTPTERENGAELTISEIAGFEIRYTDANGQTESVIIPDGTATHYNVSEFEAGVYSFEIAVFDTDGLYSEFVSLDAVSINAPPAAVPGFIFRRANRPDPVESCSERPDCRVESVASRYIAD